GPFRLVFMLLLRTKIMMKRGSRRTKNYRKKWPDCLSMNCYGVWRPSDGWTRNRFSPGSRSGWNFLHLESVKLFGQQKFEVGKNDFSHIFTIVKNLGFVMISQFIFELMHLFRKGEFVTDHIA